MNYFNRFIHEFGSLVENIKTRVSEWYGKENDIRPLGKLEKCFLALYESNNSATTVYTLHVRSKEQLTDSQIISSLAILQRFAKPYFSEMVKENFEYKRLNTSDWRKIHEKLLEKKYNLDEGPLWCCRLIHLPSHSKDYALGIPSSYKNAYVILFSFLHVITDGETNMRTCGHFIKILSSVIDNRNVSMKPIKIIDSLDGLLPNQWKLSDVYRIISKAFNMIISRTNLFVSAHPLPLTSEMKTRTIHMEFDETETSKFLRKCKAADSSVHCAFTAAAMLAIQELCLEKAKFLKPNHRFKIGHAVNFRKYIEDDAKDIYGMYIMLMPHYFEYKTDFRENFWRYAREYTKILHTDLENGTALGKRRVMEFLMPLTKIYVMLRRLTKLCCHEFATTNIGRVDHFIDIQSEQALTVEIVSIYRSTSFHGLGMTFDHNLQTYRGRMFYNLDYFTYYVTRENAEAYSRKITEVLREVSL